MSRLWANTGRPQEQGVGGERAGWAARPARQQLLPRESSHSLYVQFLSTAKVGLVLGVKAGVILGSGAFQKPGLSWAEEDAGVRWRGHSGHRNLSSWQPAFF